MMQVLRAELLKYRRTFMVKLVVCIPLFFAVYSLVTTYLLPMAYNWNGILVLSFNWWPVTFLPLDYGLFAGMVAGQERKVGAYRALKAEAGAPQCIWLGKIGGMMVVSTLSSLVLVAGDLVCGVLQGDVPPVQVVAVAALLCWVTTWALIPLMLWMATWGGMLLSLVIGIFGAAAGVLLAPTKLWLYCPWSWATRLMCPVIGVHPNGTILPQTSPLFDAGVIPVGVGVSLAVFVVLTFFTAQWFARREVR